MVQTIIATVCRVISQRLGHLVHVRCRRTNVDRSHMPDSPELVEGYIGQNASHSAFKRELAVEKLFVYLLSGKENDVLGYLDAKIEAARQKAKKIRGAECEKFSLGIVTKGISRTEVSAIYIPSNEIALAVENRDFLWQVYAKVFSEVHRIFITYLIELYGEICVAKPEVLYRDRTISYKEALTTHSIRDLIVEKEKARLSHGNIDDIDKCFKDIGLPLLSKDDFGDSELQVLAERLDELPATRNVIEHNNGKVNQLYLDRVRRSNYKINDIVRMDTDELNFAITVTQHVAERLNKRAVEKFGLTGTEEPPKAIDRTEMDKVSHLVE